MGNLFQSENVDDLNEMVYLSRQLYSIYLDLTKNRGFQESRNLVLVMSLIKDSYRGLADRLYHRDFVPRSYSSSISSSSSNTSLDLPFHAMVYLVSCYLCSFNPESHDDLLFVKGDERSRRKKKKRKNGSSTAGGRGKATKNNGNFSTKKSRKNRNEEEEGDDDDDDVVSPSFFLLHPFEKKLSTHSFFLYDI